MQSKSDPFGGPTIGKPKHNILVRNTRNVCGGEYEAFFAHDHATTESKSSTTAAANANRYGGGTRFL